MADRFSDVIEKMQEETKKVEAKDQTRLVLVQEEINQKTKRRLHSKKICGIQSL